MKLSKFLSIVCVLVKCFHFNRLFFATIIIKTGFLQLILGKGVVFPPEWSEIQDMFDTMDGLYPRNDMEATVARTALYGSYDGDILILEGAPSNAAIKEEDFRWPGFPGNGTIPYVIDASLSSITDIIEMAMEQYNQKTCIRFVNRTNEDDYIRLFFGQGCSSFIGRIGGQQDVNLGDGCGYMGTVVHELGHAVGLYHEHQRSDRDDFINVFIQNVMEGFESNFGKTPTSQELILTNFDLTSIMIYGEYAFSTMIGQLKTLEAKNKSVTLKDPFTKPGLDNMDIVEVNKLYQCQ